MYGHFGVRGMGLSLPYAAEPPRPFRDQWIPVFEGKLTTCYELSRNVCLLLCLPFYHCHVIRVHLFLVTYELCALR